MHNVRRFARVPLCLAAKPAERVRANLAITVAWMGAAPLALRASSTSGCAVAAAAILYT
jgi:hypothetical protein